MLVELPISVNDAGQRAERYLRKRFPLLGSGRLQSLFRRKEIKIAKKPVDPGYMLQAGDVLRVFGIREEEAQVPPKGAPTAERHPPPSILFEDHELLVVDKPSGMAAHPGSGIAPGASLIERVQAYLAAPASGAEKTDGLAPGWGTELFRPALVHRLDKETSGVLLIAKSGPMLRTLTEALRAGRIRKRYLALVAGHPRPAAGTIDVPLARIDSTAGAKSLAADDGEGKESVTHYETIRRAGDFALLRVTLETGRMHQIRAHLAHIGHPIVGDTRYDKPSGARARMKAAGVTRLFLHAEELSWRDGATRRTFRAPPPPELERSVAGPPPHTG